MNKAYSMILGLVLFVFYAQAQQKRDSTSLHQSLLKLNKALVEADAKILHRILHKKLTYAHSNGWVEHKKELIKDLKKGKFAYRRITLDQVNISVNGTVALVKTKGLYEINMNRQDLQFKLNVLQVWHRKRNKWILMSRQSAQEP